MHPSTTYKTRGRQSLAASQKDSYLVDFESPLYKCVSTTNQKIKSSSLIDEGYDWGKWYRRPRISNVSPNLAKSTPSLFITTYRETVTLPVDGTNYHRNRSITQISSAATRTAYQTPDNTGHHRNRSISPVPSSTAVSFQRIAYLSHDNLSYKRDRSISPVLSASRISPTKLGYLNHSSSSHVRSSSTVRRSLPAKLSSSRRSSSTLPSYSRSSGIYSDFLDDDQMSTISSMTGSISLASGRSGTDPLLRIAPGSASRSLLPWFLSELNTDPQKRHHTASDILQDEMRHGKNTLVNGK